MAERKDWFYKPQEEPLVYVTRKRIIFFSLITFFVLLTFYQVSQDRKDGF